MLSAYAETFKNYCQQAELIKLTRRTPGTRCAGAYDPHSDRYDPARDRAYHAANPSEPVCLSGIIGGGEASEEVHAFVSVGLNEEQARLLPLGEFTVDDLLYIGPADVNLLPVPEEAITSQVVEAEFPVGSGATYRLIRPDRYWYRGAPIYWYVKLEAQARDS